MPLYLGGRIREEKLQLLLNETADKYPTLHHLGYLSQAEKEKWIAGCSCFLFPSKAEGFGLPPLEAFKYGKRVVTSNLSIFREILCDAAECFDISGSEEQQINNLSKCMMCSSISPESANTQAYASVLKKYDPQRLAELLKNFMLNLEDNREDSL